MSEKKPKIAVYPGTFDPITNGHIDVLERACALFDEVIITVAENSSKTPLLDSQERIELVKGAITHLPNVTVETFDGLIIEYAHQKGAVALVRGLRAVSDFDYEFQIGLMNRKLQEDVVTVFLMPNEKYTYLNSSIIRELQRLDADISEFVPPNVREYLKKRKKESR
jgi:pantetheine-phosphate adenylyltransferase